MVDDAQEIRFDSANECLVLKRHDLILTSQRLLVACGTMV